MELSDRERLVLINQYQILANLDPDESEYYEECIEILRWGFEGLYHELTTQLNSEPISRSITQEVYDIADMFVAIEHALKEGVGIEGVNARYLTFHGFYANTESSHAAFASFVAKKPSTTLAHLAESTNSPNLDAHGPQLDAYQRMLLAWNESVDKFDLSAEDLARIAAAYPHPNSPAGRALRGA